MRAILAIGALVLAVAPVAAAPAQPSATAETGVAARSTATATRDCARMRKIGGVTVPGPCWRPYADASPFNRELPHTVPLAPRSALIAERTTGFLAGDAPRFDGGVADSGDDWGHPLYFSRRSDPRFRISCGGCEIEGRRIRIPDAARPAAAGDGHLAVIDNRSGWEYDFWQVREKPGGGGILVASGGGRTRVRKPHSNGLGGGATASGFGLAAGVIRPSELASGHIDHALFMIARCSNGSAVWPAGSNPGTSCAAQGLPNYGAPAVGQHFFLRMGVRRINSLPLRGWQKTILRAMARYGMFVGDTGGQSWGVMIESGSGFTSFGLSDPWTQLGARLGAPPSGPYYRFDLTKAVDWAAHLAVAKPCASRRRCG